MARRGPAQKLGLRTAGTREAWQWLQLEQASPHHRPTPRDVLAPRAGPETAALLTVCKGLQLPESGTPAWQLGGFWA